MRLNFLAEIVFLSGLGALIFAYYSWRHRSGPGFLTFSAFMCAMAVYVLGYSLELASLDLPLMLFWSKISYLGIFLFPTLFLVFVIQYTGNDQWLTSKKLALLFAVPIFLLTAKWSDDFTHLVYSSTWIDTSAGFPLLGFTRGPLYPLALYSSIPVMAGIVLLWIKQQHTPQIYRQQATLLALSAMLPLLVFIAYMSGFQPFPNYKFVDWNGFMYVLWGSGLTWAIFRYQLFDLKPNARDTLIEIMNDAMIVLDDRNRLADANPEAARILGWSNLPIGQPASKVFSVWEDLQAACQTYAATNGLRMEIQQPTRTQDTFYDLSISPLLNRVGIRIGLLIVLHDITGRKLAEQELRASQETFQRYFNNAPVGICTIAPDRHWLDVNDRIYEITGYSAAELSELTWLDLTFPADHDKEVKLAEEMLRNQRDAYQLDKRIVHKTGALIDVSIDVTCYRNPDGKVRYFLASVVDITERKKGEEALQKMASYEERQRLARDLHDSVNQSIHGLVLLSETLTVNLEKNNPEHTRLIAERLQKSAQQALKETRLMLYQMKPTDVGKRLNLIEAVESRLQMVENHAGVQTQFIQEGSVDAYPQDWSEGLFRVTMEALNNSLKHADAKKVKVVLCCAPHELSLEIADDGKGFDPAMPRSGGLGLQNMQERVRLLGGECLVLSTPGKGTRVCVTVKG